ICSSLLRVSSTRALSIHRSNTLTRFRQYANSSTPTIEHYVQSITQASSSHTIHTHYPNLVAKLKESQKLDNSSTRKILNEPQIHKMMSLLAASGRPSDLQRLQEMLLDMPLVFGLNPTVDTHTAIIHGLIKRGNIHTIRRWLENMPKSFGHISP